MAAFSFHTQNGMPSGPVAVFLIFDNALNTCVDENDSSQVSTEKGLTYIKF